MARFRIANAAIADLMDIGRITEVVWGKEQRNHYLARLDKAFHTLAKRPHIGQPVDDIRIGYRRYFEGKHVIFYRLADGACVEIIRILHQHMDISRHL